jgi:hypothetical protein
MFQQNNGLKQVGVLQQGGPNESATPKKITHFAKVETFAVRYGDDGGTAHTVLLLKAGEQWYMPPNAEPYAQALKPIAPWLAKQLTEHLASMNAPAPKPDTLDVMGAEAK